MFLPISKQETEQLGWDYIDVILISGDAYIDSPFSDIAVVGKYLLKHGFKVAVISQPDIKSDKDITIFGEPKLFWGVSAGCVDSLVANYTSTGKPRKQCDFTPNGINNKRPDRASIVYTGLIRRYFKKTRPIVLGGIEASLRRIAHYDFKTDAIRRSILFDSKADYIIYGMGEKPILELAIALKNNGVVENINGLCYISKEKVENSLELPSYEEVVSDKKIFYNMFKIFYNNSEAISGKRLMQKTGDRYLIQNPPAYYNDNLLDEISNMEYEREVHPHIKGKVKALDTIKTSIISHRGCFGSCSFCAIAVHQGKRVISRSIMSIEREVKLMASKQWFHGTITDIGGPTGNMYMMKCKKMENIGACNHKHCLYPTVCTSMNTNHNLLLNMLECIKNIKGVKNIFATSGIRADLVINDKKYGVKYISEITKQYVSGQLKMAPESADIKVLKAMKKPDNNSFLKFCKLYKNFSKKYNKNQFISCYFIAAHPAECKKEAQNTRKFIEKYLDFNPEQVQIFTPTPSTWATCTYHTGLDEDGNSVYVEKLLAKKEQYKNIIMGNKNPKGSKINNKKPTIHKN